MIVKSKNIRTGTSPRVLAYVQAAGDNEKVRLIAGGDAAFDTVESMADMNGQKYSVLHITISPKHRLTGAGLQIAIDEIYDEFGIDESDPFIITEHTKLREDAKTDAPHYHLVVPAADRKGAVRDRKFSMKRDELISRACEIRLGHEIVPGAHNDYVIKGFKRKNRPEMAVAFQAALAGDTSSRISDYSSAMHHLITRKDEAGLKMMITSFLETLKGRPHSEIASGLYGFEGQFPDVRFDIGTRRGASTLMAYIGEDISFGIKRQLGSLKKSEIAEIIKFKGVYEHGPADEEDGDVDGREDEQGHAGNADPDRADRGQSRRHLQHSVSGRSRKSTISARNHPGRDPQRADPTEAGEHRNRWNTAQIDEGNGTRQGRPGSAPRPRLSARDRLSGRLAAERVRLRMPAEKTSELRVTLADRVLLYRFAKRPDIQAKRAELRLLGSAVKLDKGEHFAGRIAGEQVRRRRPFLRFKGLLRLSKVDLLLGNKGAGRLSSVIDQHRTAMSQPLDLPSSSGPGPVLDIKDPYLMQKLSEQLARSLGNR